MPCAAVNFAGEPRSRPPPRIAYKKDPELAHEHTPSLHLSKTLPSHQEDLEEVSSPDSGRPVPPRPPPRFAPVRPSPAPKPRQLPPLATRSLTPSSIWPSQLHPTRPSTTRTAVRRSKARRRRGARRPPPPPPTDAEGCPEHGGTLRSPCLAVDRRRRPPRLSGADELRPPFENSNLTGGTRPSASQFFLNEPFSEGVFCQSTSPLWAGVFFIESFSVFIS